jgi:glucokinase
MLIARFRHAILRAMRPVVAVDLGGTNIRAAFYPSGEPPATKTTTRPTRAADGAQAVLDHINEAIEALAIPAEARSSLAVAIGAPGPLDRERGVIVHAPNLPGWLNLPLGQILHRHWNCPVLVENDANMAALGEWRFGAGRGAHHLIMLTLGTGIGGGIIVDDQLVRGARGLAGEVGHIPVQPDGPLCSCGRPGHLEALASGPAIARQVREKGGLQRSSGPDGATAEEISAAARTGDAVATAVLHGAAQALGLALAGLVHTFNPERIILGGGVARAGGPFLENVRRALSDSLMSPAFGEALEVVPSSLGDEAALLGGLALVQTSL